MPDRSERSGSLRFASSFPLFSLAARPDNRTVQQKERPGDAGLEAHPPDVLLCRLSAKIDAAGGTVAPNRHSVKSSRFPGLAVSLYVVDELAKGAERERVAVRSGLCYPCGWYGARGACLS